METHHNKRKYSLNDNFFSEENEVMAYWLGFLAADGYCPTNTNEIGVGLARIDKEHLEQLKQDLKAENPVKDFTNNQGFEVSKLVVTSKKMRNDLAEYCIIPQKTFLLEFPTNLKRKYWIDYIRGYFDGDGSFSYIKHNSSLRWQIGSVNKNFLQIIIDFLYDEYGIPKVKVQEQTRNRKATYYCIQYSTNSSKKIFDILYYPNCRYLKRKYNKMIEGIAQHNKDTNFLK